jgi:hypothetical protein
MIKPSTATKATKAILGIFAGWMIVLAAYALGVLWLLSRVLNLVEKWMGR